MTNLLVAASSVSTLIGPRGFVLYHHSDLGFGLKASGETVFFKTPDGSRVLDAVQFEAQADRVSLGRWPDGADAFYPMAARTPGAPNSNILIGDIVINELMYSPISGDDNEQFIELYNAGTNNVNLGGWEFTSGVSFSFPSNTFLAPDHFLVVARNAATLLSHYTNLNSGNTIGDYSGKLSHNGDRVALAMPQALTQTNNLGQLVTNTIFVVEDEVTYEKGKGGRWGQWSGGGGSSDSNTGLIVAGVYDHLVCFLTWTMTSPNTLFPGLRACRNEGVQHARVHLKVLSLAV
jgi:hypothetical protein